MVAYPDDLRFSYAEDLAAETERLSITGVAATKSSQLSPGRYVARISDLVLDPDLVWLRQGPWETVAAEAQAPSAPFMIGGTVDRAVDLRALNAPLVSFIVRPGRDGVSAILNLAAEKTADFTYNDNGGAGDSEITRAAGDFTAEGFANGQTIRVIGTASNDGVYTIKTAAALTLTLDGLVLTDEGPVSSTLRSSGTAVLTLDKVSRDRR